MPEHGTREVGRGYVGGFLVALAIVLVRCYQGMLRPFLAGSCRFYPSCSEYAIEAFRLHGPLRGLMLSSRRVMRCHPLSSGGLDLVPPRIRETTDSAKASSALVNDSGKVVHSP